MGLGGEVLRFMGRRGGRDQSWAGAAAAAAAALELEQVSRTQRTRLLCHEHPAGYEIHSHPLAHVIKSVLIQLRGEQSLSPLSFPLQPTSSGDLGSPLSPLPHTIHCLGTKAATQ